MYLSTDGGVTETRHGFRNVEPCDQCQNKFADLNHWKGYNLCPDCTADFIKSEMEDIEEVRFLFI